MAAPPPLPTCPAEPRPESGNLLTDIVAAFSSPGRLFTRLSIHNRWGAAVLVLMLLQALYGLGLISTGVPDYDIAVRTQREIAKAAAKLQGDDTSEELARTVEALEKGEAFSKLLARVLLLVGSPLRLFVGVLVVASVLFVAVALGPVRAGSGANPDWSLLAGIVTFATFVEVPRLLLRLLLIANLHVSRVETSAAAFVSAPQVGLPLYLLLRRFDPFDLWYWGLIGYGLCRTGQLSRRWAILVVLGLVLFANLGQCVSDIPDLADVNVTMNLDSQ